VSAKISLSIVFYFLFSFSGFSKEDQKTQEFSPSALSDSTKIIETLLTQRHLLIDKGESTKPVDQQLSSLGVLPSAILSKTINATSFLIKFVTYKTIKPEHIERITQRLRSSFPTLKKCEITTEGAVTAEFESSASDETIQSFLLILGYKGYEIK
jgi:hypothetical protein